jgi:small-conductance mechanosensitive channel
MRSDESKTGAARSIASPPRCWLRTGLILVALLLAPGMAALAQPAPQQPPPRVQELLRLLEDPATQAWLRQQQAAPAPESSGREARDGEQRGSFFAERLARARAHAVAAATAVPHMPAAFAGVVARIGPELSAHGPGWIFLLCVAFLGLGLGAEWLYLRSTRGGRARIMALPLDGPTTRSRAAGMRLALALGRVTAFALGSVGAFLIFRWPPLLREVVLTYLQVFLAIRLAIVLSHFLLAPDAARLRIVPMSDDAARHWSRWIAVLVGWFSFSRLTSALLQTLGLPADALGLFIATVALVWLGFGLVALWRRPPRYAGSTADMRPISWLVSAIFVGLWILLLGGALTAFWFVATLVLLPLALKLGRESVAGLLRADGARPPGAVTGSLVEVCLERGLRAVLIIGAIAFIGRLWEIDLTSLAASETFGTRLFAGALKATVILLMADLLWHVLRAAIDGQVVSVGRADSGDDGEAARRRARVRTLLPILRNLLAVVIAAMAAMMALSQLGIEIGPLIAGAGVIGVAVGFGAQTLVRDVISGMFYLLDDAFRVGEYIQSGSYKGTVESFSLRSVKLRHHRGPLYTVPFGQLGAVQNMSRDWVIDKITISVTYDADLDKAKKLIKQIGRDLAEDPEFKPLILEPLKMQGVEAFGDYAVNLRLKMKTKPGEQFVIRRRAYAAIKKAFEANGIHFAFPTVQVAGAGETDPGTVAAAQRVAETTRAQPQPG